MAHYTDDDLDALSSYGGPSGSKSEARALLDDLRSARWALRAAEAQLARPEVQEAIAAADRAAKIAEARATLDELGAREPA